MRFRVVRDDDQPAQPSPPLPQVLLEVRRGRAQQHVRPVNVPVFLIGTAPDCDLVLGDPRFPQVHTYLFVTPEHVRLRHLEVGPEVTVGERVVTTIDLVDGDIIRMGSYEFAVRISPRSETTPRPHLQVTTLPDNELLVSMGGMSGLTHLQQFLEDVQAFVEQREHDVSTRRAIGS